MHPVCMYYLRRIAIAIAHPLTPGSETSFIISINGPPPPARADAIVSVAFSIHNLFQPRPV